jgi:hypothetical protein
MDTRKNRQAVKTPAPVRGTFENPMNQEQWVCENIHDIKTIDGVEFLQVHRYADDRTVLMRKDALKRIKK